ncbi:ADP-ribosyl-[dinitrogen reductase] glycohydrolase [Pseudoclavibacter triregionum]|nr:ADP-ribosyl-[dinitrogen reductase] glycohydrolase [Pseudoclavibacter triregionum]
MSVVPRIMESTPDPGPSSPEGAAMAAPDFPKPTASIRRDSAQLDRAVGAVLASACADARGSQYEFGPQLPDSQAVEFGVGHFGHARGEWTDDTSMAIPILRQLAEGASPLDAESLGHIVGAWDDWSHTSRDVGIQTATVLRCLDGMYTEEAARACAQREHERSGRSAGNGSLMRTGPLALGFLAPGREPALVEAAGRVAQLTHWEDDNLDACAIWCLAIRHAILTGELDVRGQLAWIPEPRRERWAGFIDEALAPGRHPRHFREKNGWVVRAFQGALCAIAGAESLPDAVDRAIRGGGDTDTVAAIAGSLAGAVHGAAAVPDAWKKLVHGWPGLGGRDLERLARRAVAATEEDGMTEQIEQQAQRAEKMKPAAAESRLAKKVVYIDMDNTLVDFSARLKGLQLLPEVLERYKDDMDEIPGIFALMPPVPGAVEAFRKLAEVFDVYILSTAPWKNPSAWQHKVEWVHLHLGMDEDSPAYKRLILSHHKNLNRGDFLIDDRPTKRGAAEFEGEVIGFGAAPFDTWDKVVEYLLPKA